MGFFKNLFGDAADELKKNLEDAKNEMLSNLEEVKQDVMGGFTDRTSNSRDDDEEDDEEPKILLGDFHDGVLTIREGITELDDESLEHYKRIRKITFPASLERLDSNVIDEQERLEELDFSKVTKLKTIPDDFISGENKVRKLIIPNGVTEVGDGFLGEAKSGAEIFVPASVRKLGYITGNNDNDMTVYLFAANIDISDVEEDVKTLYVLPQYYGWYAKALKKCDSEARLREMPEEMMGVYGATSLGELKEIAKDNASIIAKTDEIQASQLKAKQKQESQKKKEKVRVSFTINGDEGFTRITMYPLIGKECQQTLKNGVEHDRRTGAMEVSQDCIDKLSELLTEKNEQLPLEFLFAHVCTPTELIVTDEESDEEIYNDEYEINPRYGIMSMDEAVDNYEDDEEELEKFKKYLTDTVHIPDDNYISIGIAKTWDKLPESYIEGEGFVPSVIGETLRVASEDDIALLHGETGLSDSTITFNMEIEDEFDPDKLDFINFDADYSDVSSVLQETLAADYVSMNAIMYDGKMYFAQPQNIDLGENEGDDYYDIVNHHLEGEQEIDIEPESEPKSDENASLTEDSKTESVDDNITDIVQKIKEKLNKNTENESMPEPVLEPKPEPEADVKVEVEQKEEPIENGGLFSARLEAMIAAALQDGVLTDKEREILKRRVEKEGEDWDEVEMIIEARLAEMNPVASTPSSRTSENNTVSKDTTPQDNKNTTPQDVSSKADNEYPETILEYKKKKMDALRNAQSHKNDSEQAKQIWRKAVSEIKMIDTIIRDGVKSVDELKQKLQIEQMKLQMEELAKEKEQMKLQMEEQAKAKEVPALKVDKPISKEYVRTEEDKYATSIDIPEGVTIIPDYCFLQCSCMESITLPSTIKQIGKSAFDGCSALTSIDIPEGVTIIPDYCFDGCSSMESITLPSTIKQIGRYAFNGCSALTSIDIPEGVTIIPDYCFDECSSMESITLPSTIKQIGERAFNGCSALTSIELPSTIKQIGECAFKGCSALTSIDIPEGVTIISEWFFGECKKLNSVTLPTTIKKIEDYAFYECNKVKTISIPNGCERLEELGYFDSEPRIFLPPSLCSIDVISTRNKRLLIYCFAPQLEELEIFKNCQKLYVLPQYLDSYKSQAEAEEVEIDIKPMPDEYLYFYDN